MKRAIGPSLREAERALNEALALVQRGELMAPTRETFADYARRWIDAHRPHVEPATAVDYASTIENHLLPFFGRLKLSSVTADVVRAYVRAKGDGTAPVRDQPKGRTGQIKRRPAPKTIRNHVTLLCLMLGHAASDGLIPRNPLEGIDRRRPVKPKVAHRERDYLRPHEVPVYLDSCSEFWRPRALTLILTGMRIGELLALRWEDIDWHGRAIIVRRSLKTKGGDAVGSTKGDEDGRRVDIGARLVHALRDHQARAAEVVDDYDDGLVFPAPGGGHDHPQRVLRQEHREALKRAGLRLTLVNHELRHTSAATWLSLSLGLEYVRRQMGHRSIRTTITNYGHLEPSMHAGAADRAEDALMVPGTTVVPRSGRATKP